MDAQQNNPNLLTTETIAARIFQVLNELEGGNFSSSVGTKEIKQRFGKLGRDLGFLVSCNRAHYAADDPEWLYDMTWWLGEPHPQRDAGIVPYMHSITMAMEVELSQKTNHIDEDFQKLVQARADVRLWISTAHRNADQHIARCLDQIGSFKSSQAGDEYVLGVYDWSKRALMRQRYTFPGR